MKKLIILVIFFCACEDTYKPKVEMNGLAEANMYGYICNDTYSFTVIFSLNGTTIREECADYFSKTFHADPGDTIWLGSNSNQTNSGKSKTFKIYIDNKLVAISPHSMMYIVK